VVATASIIAIAFPVASFPVTTRRMEEATVTS
jgi:hypothetical protein